MTKTPRLAGLSLIGETGFEPATARPPAGCATRLRHSPWLCFRAKRATGLEPAPRAWKAPVQPLTPRPQAWAECTGPSGLPGLRRHRALVVHDRRRRPGAPPVVGRAVERHGRPAERPPDRRGEQRDQPRELL